MSGAAVALPIWAAEFMQRAHAALRLPVEDFVLPEDIPKVDAAPCLWGYLRRMVGRGGVYLLF